MKEFNGRLNCSYTGLKERLSIYGKIDEDVFHDAYLAARKQIILSSVGIEDLESYLFGYYKRVLQSGTKDENHYDSPGDEYFARLGETDRAEKTEEREEMLTGCDKLIKDIQKFLKRHLSHGNYGILMLRFYETGSLPRAVARYMGEKTSAVTHRAQAMMESVRANRKFIARRRLTIAGEAARRE